MPDIGEFHPQIVHFAVALLFAGVLARLTALLPLPERWRFLGPGATTLIVAGTVAALLAVHSGIDAHGPVEQVPGARSAVQDHEEWGERARNVFIAVALLELGALALGARAKAVAAARVAAGVVGAAGLFVLYEAAEHGGDLVYSYAGGVGIRSGDSADVRRLLIAGLFQGARTAREAGRSEEAARLTEELLRTAPLDVEVRLLALESLLRDRGDPAATLAGLDSLNLASDNRRLRIRAGILRADALSGAGQGDSARALLEALAREFPDSPTLQRRMQQAP